MMLIIRAPVVLSYELLVKNKKPKERSDTMPIKVNGRSYAHEIKVRIAK